MKRYLFFVLCLLIINSHVTAHDQQSRGSIEYDVSMSNPHTHYFEVEIILKNYDRDFIDFKMPVWTPGSYLIREYAKNVEGFSAVDNEDGNKLNFHKINKNTWRVERKNENDILISYKVYAFEGSVRMSYLDDSHAFIMANTLLMYVEDLRNASSVLKINIPDNWEKVSTSLSRIEGNENEFYIPNYDILVDSPIEIGNHDVIEFVAAGVPHEVAMYGAANFNPEQIKRDLTKIVETATDVFEENPNEKYVFIVHHSDNGGGGLEHLSSTVLGVNRWTYTNSGSYNYFLSLAAHEYFHLWLVKRLKPKELEFLNFDQETYTDMLWIMEGITSYFEEKIMLRAGFHDDAKFINNLLRAMSTIQNAPGASVQSVAEAGFDTWIKFYRKNENSDNSQISYYTKGMVLGALLDLIIIDGSEGGKNLDDVLNQLYFQFYKKNGKGIGMKNFKKEVEKVSGKNLDDFFNDYIYGTKDLDNEKYLHAAGIGLVETNSSTTTKSIGVKVKQDDHGLTVTSLKKDGSAYENGISVGDELISINGYRLYDYNINSLVDQFNAGERVTFLINRKGIVKSIELDIRKDETVSYSYELLDNKTKHQEKVYKVWLSK